MVIPVLYSCCDVMDLKFQSPIFRGLWWYPCLIHAISAILACFSPLFFGVYGDTWNGWPRWCADLRRFSPLFFGVYGDTEWLPGVGPPLYPVSVPYFSGFMVILLGLYAAGFSWPIVSVPYFSGFMVIPMRITPTKTAITGVSVPYFSGFMVIRRNRGSII